LPLPHGITLFSKLAHATSPLPGVSNGLLIYLAPVKAWANPLASPTYSAMRF